MVFFDWAMKYYLCNNDNLDILEGFLSELLYQKILIKQIVKSDENRKNKYGRFNQVEILAEADGKELVFIELQHGGIADYFYRMLNAVKKSITDCNDVRKAYSINIIYFDFIKGDDYIYCNNKGFHTNNKLYLSDLQHRLCHTTVVDDLNPEKYIISICNFSNNEPKNTLDEWIFYLSHSKIQDHFTAQGMDKARKILLMSNLTDEEQRQYWRSIDGRRNDDSIIQTAITDGKYQQ